MADDEHKGLWRRIRDKLTGRENKPQQPAEEPAPKPRQEPQDEASAPEADIANEQATQPPDPTPPEEPQDPSPPTPAEDGEPKVLETSELKTNAVGRVYAGALLELAREQGVLDELALEVQGLLPITQPGGELYPLMTNPAIGDAERSAIIQRVFDGRVSPLLYRFLRVLADKRRLGSLPEVLAGFLLAVAEARGQVDVEAFVAVELDADTARGVVERIGGALGKTVNLRQRVDPSLIGGMKLKIGDRLIDASVASQLRVMKRKMIAAGRR